MSEVKRIEFSNSNYFSRAWKISVEDKNIFKTVLMLSLIMLIPFIGPIISMGYILEWARLTAWGIESYPKTKNIEIGKCIKSGFRAFVITFVWALLLAAIVQFLDGGNILSYSIFTSFDSLVSIAIYEIYFAIVLILSLYATIYQDFTKGFKV